MLLDAMKIPAAIEVPGGSALLALACLLTSAGIAVAQDTGVEEILTRFDEVRKLVSGLANPIRETSSTLGRPDVKLVDAARDAGAGLIVMGAYGRNRITDFFIGSNAAAVARTSPAAVLLAR